MIIKDANGNDVTANYAVTTKNGTLTINAADDSAVLGASKKPETPAATAKTPEKAEPEATATISDDKVPLGVHEEKCFIHWILLLLALLYTAYNVTGIVARARRIHELQDDDSSKQKA